MNKLPSFLIPNDIDRSLLDLKQSFSDTLREIAESMVKSVAVLTPLDSKPDDMPAWLQQYYIEETWYLTIALKEIGFYYPCELK